MFVVTLLPLLLASLASAGPIIARQDGAVASSWVQLPVIKVRWNGGFNKCIVAGGNHAFAPVQVMDCDAAGANSGWKMSLDPNVPTAIMHGEFCLTGGDVVTIQDCSSAEGTHERQVWSRTRENGAHITDLSGNTCLDVKDGGTQLQSYQCYPDAVNQMFKIQD